MKAEELLFSLDHVGEDLLAGAEQTVLVRKRRPWLGAAAAALLIAAIGAGGFFLWRHLGRNGPNDPASPGGTVESTETNDPELSLKLPMLDVEGNYPKRDIRTVAYLDDLPDGILGSAVDVESLPVYRRAAEGEAVQTDQALLAIGQRAVERLGVGPIKDYEFTKTEAGEGWVTGLKAGTELGPLTVNPDGQILLLFDEDSMPVSHTTVSFDDGATDAERKAVYYESWQEDLARQAAELLGLEGWQLEPCTDWNPALSSYHSFYLYPVRENPEQQLISRYFERVTLLTVSGNELRGLSWYEPLETEAGADPTLSRPGLSCLGSYPVIPQAYAEYQLGYGYYLGGNLPGGQDLAYTEPERTDLVYLPDENYEILMPFYRFWYLRDPAKSGPLAEYCLLYVPAVMDYTLNDWNFQDEQAGLSTHPKLPIGDRVRGDEYLVLEDPEAYAASNPWEFYGRVNLQDVYKAPAAEAPAVGPRAMNALLARYAELMGLSVTEDPGLSSSGGQLSEAFAETDQGRLWVSSNGSVALEYDEAHRYTPSLDPSLSGKEAEAAMIEAFVLHLSDPGAETPPDGYWPWHRVEGRAAELDSLTRISPQLCSVAEVYSDYNSYHFDRIRLYYRDGTLYGFRIDGPRPYDSSPFTWLYGSKTDGIGKLRNDNTFLNRVGGYPIITREEARDLYVQGRFLPGTPAAYEQSWDDGFPGGAGDPAADPVELVYCVNADGEYLLPYYRFLHAVGMDEAGNVVCQACYVPAVNALFLEDWPPDGQPVEPVEPED